MRKQPELDYEQLQKQLASKKKQPQSLQSKVAVEAVRNRMHKVAFDVYTVDNDPYDGLWRLEANADDGKEYLVRLEDEAENVKTASAWTATSNESGTSITLSYKGMPIQRMSSKIFGFSKEDAGLFKRALLEKVETNNSFRDKIIDMQPEEKKAELLKEFPELFVK